MKVEPKDYIPVIGWVVVFALGVLSGGVIVPRLTRKRKVFAWALVSENELVPKRLSESLGIPVEIKVGSETPSSLTTVQARVGNGGNEVIEKLEATVSFNRGAQVLNVRPVDDLGDYEKHIDFVIHDSAKCKLKFAFLNPEQSLALEFLVSNYESGSVDVGASAPGVELKRREASRWDVPTSIFQSFALSLAGFRYDPSIGSLNRIAEELKSIRRQIADRHDT